MTDSSIFGCAFTDEMTALTAPEPAMIVRSSGESITASFRSNSDEQHSLMRSSWRGQHKQGNRQPTANRATHQPAH